MRVVFIVFLILCNICFAQPRIKPNISSTKLLNTTEQIAVKEYLEGKIFNVGITPVKNDYVDKHLKGTVLYNPEHRNYSRYTVIVPDGTTLRNCNFAQKEPHTVAIIGKNLTFIDCNLTNVEPDPTWIYEGGCGTVQQKRVFKNEIDIDLGGGIIGKKVIVSHQIEKNNKFVEVAEDEEIVRPDNYTEFINSLNTP